jgi:hypothetical protein
MMLNLQWIKSLITETELGQSGKLEKQSQYNVWQLVVTGKLLKKGLRGQVSSESKSPNEEKNEMAMGIILENLGELFANQVKDEQTAYLMWEKVKILCNADTVTNCRGVEEFINKTKITEYESTM